MTKDAGFVYESFQNESSNLEFLILRNESTKRIFGKQAYETNPQYKSLRFGFTNPPVWIRKDSFCAIVLRICKDSWGFVGFVKTGRIFGSSGHKRNPRFKSLRIGLVNLDSRICEVGFVTTIRNKSTFLRISYTIPASLVLTNLIFLRLSRWFLCFSVSAKFIFEICADVFWLAFISRLFTYTISFSIQQNLCSCILFCA